MTNNRHLIAPLAKLLHAKENSVEQAWRIAKKTAKVEGRKGDWFLILKLTLVSLEKQAQIPSSEGVVTCLGVTGKVKNCTPTTFDLEDENGVTVRFPLFSLIL